VDIQIGDVFHQVNVPGGRTTAVSEICDIGLARPLIRMNDSHVLHDPAILLDPHFYVRVRRRSSKPKDADSSP
jgi:hypothetical protein